MKQIRLTILLTLAVLALCGSLSAEEQPPDNQWKFSITPYLWLPNVNGDLKYDIPPGAGGSPEVETGPNNYLENLQAVFMISGEVRRDRWVAFTDFIYLDFTNEDSEIKGIDFDGGRISAGLNGSTTSSLKGATWTLGAGYTVLPDRPVSLDAFGGLRYFTLKTSTDWQLALDVTGPGGGQTFPWTGDVSEREELWDGIIGARGRVWFGGSNWAIPYYLDVGTGSSSFTWQGMLGIAYTYKWFGATLAYRNLYYDQKGDRLVQDLRFTGPALGATFSF